MSSVQTIGHKRVRVAAGKRQGKSDRPRSETLLQRYRKRPTAALRNQLVERYRSYVEGQARVLAARLPRRVDVGDLVHAGIWGLIRAIENFRAELGGEFLAFLRPRVRGAMLDELRNLDYFSRLYRAREKARDAAAVRLRDALDREPSDAELAAELGVSESRLRQYYAGRPPLRSLDGGGGQLGGGDGDFVELHDPCAESPLDAIDRQDLLATIEASLQPIEWEVLRMHYLEGLSGREVASRLNLSASRICQIHVRVLARLKHRLRVDAEHPA